MWYYVFISVCFMLAVFGNPKDRPTWTVLTAMSFVSLVKNAELYDMSIYEYFIAIVSGVDISGVILAPWTVFLGTAVDSATVVLLLVAVGDKLALRQSLLLMVAIASQFVLYVDLKTGSNMVYDNYEIIVKTVGAGQLALGIGNAEWMVEDSIRQLKTLFRRKGIKVAMKKEE